MLYAPCKQYFADSYITFCGLLLSSHASYESCQACRLWSSLKLDVYGFSPVAKDTLAYICKLSMVLLLCKGVVTMFLAYYHLYNPISLQMMTMVSITKQWLVCGYYSLNMVTMDVWS